jgi:hypothetical protein
MAEDDGDLNTGMGADPADAGTQPTEPAEGEEKDAEDTGM